MYLKVCFMVARFFLVHDKPVKCTKLIQNVPNGHKISQMSINIPNVHKISQMSIKYSKMPYNISTFSSPRPSKFTQNGIFGLKICHLATLAC
jgi:hypothetical protein